MIRKLPPAGLVALIALVCVGMCIGAFAGTALIAGENPMQIFTSPSRADKTVEVWFDNKFACNSLGNGTELCVGIEVGRERIVTVVCPNYFEPDLSRVYLATIHRFEAIDGRIAPPVWTLLTDINGHPLLPLRQ